MRRIFLFITVLMFFFVSCKKEKDTNNPSNVADDHTIIQDQYGRQLILHGLNTSSGAKSTPGRMPWIEERHVEREAKDFGFNYVRYLVFWDAIEPEQDVFDPIYLDKVEERVNWYTSRGMHVMIDMHQDLYSLVFGGDGAPQWAIQTNGSAPIEMSGGTPWWVKNIDPAVINSWINFWGYSKYKYLQDHYALAWQKVMERFKNNPNIIGYDLMNEPWGGDLIKVFLTGEFEKVQLKAFYDRLIPKLRAIEPNKYFFFEPTPAPVTFGAPSNLPKINDTRTTPHLVYAPHCYPFDTHEGTGYTASSKQQLKDWERERKKEITKQGNIPLLCGEFGLSPTQAGYDQYLKDANAMFDRNLWHWAYWSNDQGGWSPFNGDAVMPLAQYLLRVFPHATAGKINSFDFNPDTKVFNFSYKNNAAITKPTEIYIPQQFYPSGWNLNVTGTTNYTQTFDDATHILKLNVPENNADVIIEITPK